MNDLIFKLKYKPKKRKCASCNKIMDNPCKTIKEAHNCNNHKLKNSYDTTRRKK